MSTSVVTLRNPAKCHRRFYFPHLRTTIPKYLGIYLNFQSNIKEIRCKYFYSGWQKAASLSTVNIKNLGFKRQNAMTVAF